MAQQNAADQEEKDEKDRQIAQLVERLRLCTDELRMARQTADWFVQTNGIRTEIGWPIELPPLDSYYDWRQS